MEVTSNCEELLKDFEIEIILNPDKTSKQFKTFKGFYAFIVKEVEFWEICVLPDCSNIRNHFRGILKSLNELIDVSNNNTSEFKNNLLNYSNKFKQAVYSANSSNSYCVYSTTTFGIKLKYLYGKNPSTANAFYHYCYDNTLNAITTPSYLQGAIEAYQFNNKINLSPEIATEEKLLKELYNRYSSEIDSLQADYLNKCENNSKTYNAFTEEMNEWKEFNQDELNTYLESKKQNLSTLESTYKEHLRFKEPAKHWETLSIEYNAKGNSWRLFSIITAICISVILGFVFYNLPIELQGVNIEINFETIRSTLILTVIISIGIYLLKLFVKLSISAYHLSRDANERYVLTSFYLSLINEKAITEEDRNVVLQSLFSRADTGLLKGDSGPTLPDGIVNQIAKLMRHQ